MTKRTERFALVAASAVFALVGLSSSAHAQVVPGTGTVTVVLTYPSFGGGDFTFRISSPPAGCEGGFWLSPSQPGFKIAVAFILQARATGETVLVGADRQQLWNGSGDRWCKVDYVGTPY